MGNSGCSGTLLDACCPMLYERHPAAAAFQNKINHAVPGILHRGMPSANNFFRSTRIESESGAKTRVASPACSIRKGAVGTITFFHPRKCACRDAAKVRASSNRLMPSESGSASALFCHSNQRASLDRAAPHWWIHPEYSIGVWACRIDSQFPTRTPLDLTPFMRVIPAASSGATRARSAPGSAKDNTIHSMHLG